MFSPATDVSAPLPAPEGAVKRGNAAAAAASKITVATVIKGAKGHTEGEINNARAEALTGMMHRVEKQLEAAE